MDDIQRPAIEALDDEHKLVFVIGLAKTMSDEFKNKVIRELVETMMQGETQLTVSSNEQIVKIDFGRPLAWFAIPKAHALQLGMSLMQHAGAALERVDKNPSA